MERIFVVDFRNIIILSLIGSVFLVTALIEKFIQIYLRAFACFVIRIINYEAFANQSGSGRHLKVFIVILTFNVPPPGRRPGLCDIDSF